MRSGRGRASARNIMAIMRSDPAKTLIHFRHRDTNTKKAKGGGMLSLGHSVEASFRLDGTGQEASEARQL